MYAVHKLIFYFYCFIYQEHIYLFCKKYFATILCILYYIFLVFWTTCFRDTMHVIATDFELYSKLIL